MAVKSIETIINGVTTSYAYNSTTGYYEKNGDAPAKSSYNNGGHYYPITIKAVDDAGNITTINDTDSAFGNLLRLMVKESVAPVITASYPSDDARLTNPKPVISWNVTDNDSGVNPDTIGIAIDNGGVIKGGIAKATITGGYSCSYAISTNLSDGSHTIKLTAQDFDGNNAVQRTINIVVDTVPPELNVSSPANNLITNNPVVSVSGTAKDLTSGPCTVRITLNGGTPVNVSVGSNNSFAGNMTLKEGSNTITVRATDTAGKYSEVTRIITLDTVPPVITDIKIEPNPVSTGEPLKISVKVTD